MAFKRWRRFFRRIRRRRFRGRGFSRKVRGITKATVKRMHETKRVAFTGAADSTNTWTLVEITPAITQGVDKVQRIGNKIQYKFLTLNLFTQLIYTGTVAPNLAPCRVVLFSARNIVTLASDVLEQGAPATPSYPWIWVPLRSENVNVLRDWQFVLAALGSDANAGDSSVINMPVSRKLKYARRHRRNVTLASSAITTPTDPQDRLYLLIASVGAVVELEVFYGGRLSFIDI